MSGWFCVNRASVIVWGRSRKRALHGFRPFGPVAAVTARALLGLARSVAVVAAPRAGPCGCWLRAWSSRPQRFPCRPPEPCLSASARDRMRCAAASSRLTCRSDSLPHAPAALLPGALVTVRTCQRRAKAVSVVP
jgi:hypothetical protein